jgi:hypothetical protein
MYEEVPEAVSKTTLFETLRHFQLSTAPRHEGLSQKPSQKKSLKSPPINGF